MARPRRVAFQAKWALVSNPNKEWTTDFLSGHIFDGQLFQLVAALDRPAGETPLFQELTSAPFM